MSHDIIRQHPQRGGASLPASADDLWGQQQNALAAATGSGGSDVQPLKVVHRSLRGRYKLAFLLATAGALTGMTLGWTSFEKTYRARGFVRISPEIRSAIGTTEVQNDYTRYMGSESVTLRTTEIASRAMAKAAWTKAVNGTPWEPSQFASRVQAHFEGSTNDIIITFDHPNREVAVAGVATILDAYKEYRDDERGTQLELSTNVLEDKKRTIQSDIDSAKMKIAQINRDTARGNLEERAASKGKRFNDREIELDNEKDLLARMLQVKERAAKSHMPIDEQVLAKRDPVFARLIFARDNLTLELARLKQTLGPNSPQVLKIESQLGAAAQQISAIQDKLSADSFGTVKDIDGKEPVIVSESSIAETQDAVDFGEKQLAGFKADLDVVDSARFEIASLNNQIDTKTKELEDIVVRLGAAQAKSMTVNAPFRTFPDPVAAVQEDKRPTMATFGFIVGAGLPLLGLVLYGLFDRKYRYSDEATQSGGTRGVPLLGILPNLPDRLSDPSQASVAAHCVHQIRTMLQLNVLTDDGPSVLAVTSATSGDGKTSLSLALGLSFAASGSRTLLVDTDLIGAGLSARLGIREPSGVNEAIMARDPMQFVRDTDVTDLSVLPVGIEGAQNASAFSPIAVRRLMTELRKHFDLILIDTGPVLGSIEATPVVAASDAVILTVARGQNRDLVEKAINHLRAVGARLAGVVFNRANARDFERSISGISLRSVSRASANGVPNGSTVSANGKHQDSRLGPLVHSVRGTREDVA